MKLKSGLVIDEDFEPDLFSSVNHLFQEILEYWRKNHKRLFYISFIKNFSIGFSEFSSWYTIRFTFVFLKFSDDLITLVMYLLLLICSVKIRCLICVIWIYLCCSLFVISIFEINSFTHCSDACTLNWLNYIKKFTYWNVFSNWKNMTTIKINHISHFWRFSVECYVFDWIWQRQRWKTLTPATVRWEEERHLHLISNIWPAMMEEAFIHRYAN